MYLSENRMEYAMLRSFAVAGTILLLSAKSGTCLAANSVAMPNSDQCKTLPNMESASCLAGVADALDRVLTQYYEAARSSMRKGAADRQGIAGQDLSEAVDSLQQAQSSWKSYRKAHCDMVALLYTVGSGKAAGEAMCLIDLTKHRIRELWEIGGLTGLPEPT
jgi:uncharacterized protein YecT (DUF1311 family)